MADPSSFDRDVPQPEWEEPPDEAANKRPRWQLLVGIILTTALIGGGIGFAAWKLGGHVEAECDGMWNELRDAEAMVQLWESEMIDAFATDTWPYADPDGDFQRAWDGFSKSNRRASDALGTLVDACPSTFTDAGLADARLRIESNEAAWEARAEVCDEYYGGLMDCYDY